VVSFARRKPLGALGAVVALILIVVAIFAPFIATKDPAQTNAALVYAPPGSELLLGGDQVGRDVFSRLVYGTRVSLYAAGYSARLSEPP
jgi:peptide/nickel transport system permease protein